MRPDATTAAGPHEVREALAKKLTCPVDMLRVFARDDECMVRVAVAENPTCPVDALRTMATDTDWFRGHPVAGWLVRSAIAAHQACPEDLLRLFSKDEEWCVRVAVTRNQTCSKDTLVSMSREDTDDRVRFSARFALVEHHFPFRRLLSRVLGFPRFE